MYKNDSLNSGEKVKSEKDLLVESIGAIGKWQIWLCFALFMIKMPSGWNQMAILFLAPNTDFQCVDTVSDTQDQFDSICYDNCSMYLFDDSIFENTIVSQWELICDRKWLMNFTQSVLMFGLLVGSSAFGFFADRFGRRKAFLTSVNLLIISCFASSFAPDYWTFTILRGFVGFACGGTMGVSFVICMEIVGSKYREVVGSLYQIPFIIGNMTLSGFAYYLRSWNTYLLGISIPSVIFFSYYFILPESPRWLIANGRTEEAIKVITRAAKSNNMPTKDIHHNINLMAMELQISKGRTSQKANFFDLVRHPVLRKKTLCSCYMWLVVGLCFYGATQYISQTGSNIFSTVASAAAIQIPGNILAIYFNRVFGRKKTTIASFSLGGVSMLIIGSVNMGSATRLTVSCIGICLISMAFSTVYIFSSELFPTVVRNMGMGMSSTVSRVGSIIAPFVAGLSTTAEWLPPTIFGLSAMTAALLCMILPETNGKKLPDSLNDAENA